MEASHGFWFDHEKLEVYREAIALIAWLSELLETLGRVGDVRDQSDRASTSIALYIGNERVFRSHPERLKRSHLSLYNGHSGQKRQASIDPNPPRSRPSVSPTTGIPANRFVQDQISLAPASWTTSPEPTVLDKKTSVHDRRLLRSTTTVPGRPIKPHIKPLCRRERLLQGRFTAQKD
jgi:hypothetical protein